MLKGRLPIVIAAVFALAAALVAWLAVQQKRKDISQGWQPIKVMVAMRDMRAGEVVTKENLGVGEVPKMISVSSMN